MSETWEIILDLVARGEIMISEHGHDELSDDEIRVRDIVGGVPGAEVLEDYPAIAKVPAFLSSSETAMADRCMRCGEYRAAPSRPQYWSPHTAPTPRDGAKISEGGCHEKKENQEACA